MRAEVLSPAAAELGEGPVWLPEAQEVIWVDILLGEIHATKLDGSTRFVRRHAMPVGAVALGADGTIFASTPIGLVDADGRVERPLPVLGCDLRANDGKPDAAGRFIGGTMTVGDARVDAGALWSLGGGGATCLVTEATIPNGLAWSGDGQTLFWIDTPTGRVDAFDYDPETGAASERRPYLRIDPDWGSPDGMCVDTDGRLWIALWGGSSVRAFEGSTCVDVVELPTPLVTCPTFAGPDLDRLVITTASIDVSPGSPGAGDLYVVDPGVTGVEAHRLGSDLG